MKILLSTSSLHPPLTGIGNYTLNLLTEFMVLPDVRDVRCFNGKDWLTGAEQLSTFKIPQPTNTHKLPPNTKLNWKGKLHTCIRSVPLIHPLHSAIQNRNFSNRAFDTKKAIYHEPNFILKKCTLPSVATIHDLSFIHYPQFHPRERVAWLKHNLPKTLSRADFILTPSELVRNELITEYGVPEDRSKAIYLGANNSFKPRSKSQTKNVLSRFRLRHKSYILFVGTLEPRKNLEQLLDAWLILPTKLRNEYPLVISGTSGWKNSSLLAKINSLNHEAIHYLAYLDSSDLPTLYSGAAVCVSPSIYEGFGLPVLEAMASGTPVICRAGTSMDEFSGGACILLNSGSADELSSTLENMIEDEDLLNFFSIKGLEQSKRFSWSRCAMETLNVYKQIL